MRNPAGVFRAASESVLYQTSLASALLSGVYEGSTTIADLLKHGDFGLGTFNELDGELIAFQQSGLSAARRRQRAQSPAGAENAVRGDDLVPAAVPETFDHPVSRQQLHEVIDQQIPSDNLFCAPAHRRPFPPCPYPHRAAPERRRTGR